MKTSSLASLLFLFVLAPCLAQKTVSSKQKIKMVMPEGLGTNGAGVAWNPTKKIYYACFAGNYSYPLVIFSKKGAVKNSILKTEADVRGFWFNESKDRIEGTSHDEAGYFYRTVDLNGVPEIDVYKKFPDMPLPEESQTVPVFNKENQELVFRNGSELTRFSMKDGSKKGTLSLNLGEGREWGNINLYTTIYTGRAGEEYGVLDFENNKVYLFDASTGNLTKIVVLPGSSPEPNQFNFSYANGMIWLFSKSSRTWIGYSHP